MLRDFSKEALHTFAHLMPKATLHVHLEGSILPATIIKLAQKNKVSVPFSNDVEFRNCFHNVSFEGFIALYEKIIKCLKMPDDYELVAYEFGKKSARQNIYYSEVTFSIATNSILTGLDWRTILLALNKGRARAQKEFGITWSWIFDLTLERCFEPETFVAMLIQARCQGLGVIAMGLSDTIVTAKFPEYQPILDKALAAGLPVIPHAGEFEGADNVHKALDACKAVRIDHGVRCIEDPSLVRKLVQERIPLDVCITSNVRLGVFPSYQHHPIRTLWDAGVIITLGADDPSLFGTDLNQEYDHLIDDYHFTADELERVSLNGVKASLLSQIEKEALMKKFTSKFAELRAKILE
ncbi:MAG: adenosine deaminase [Candidatus Babeliales bacterium]